MPNITTIGAGIYTSLSFVDLPVVTGVGSVGVSIGRSASTTVWVAEFESRTAWTNEADGALLKWNADAAARSFGRIREFPNLGIPANVVNVPQYGQASSSQVVGQSDPPNLDFTFNYVPVEHAFINTLRSAGSLRLFRVRMSNAELITAVDGGTNASGGTDPASVQGVILPYETVSGTTTVYREFSDFFFFGSVASFEIIPNLTDSNQLNVTLTIDGQLVGPTSYKPNAAKASAPTYGTPAELGEG
jgi:hypothetical protein